MNKVEQFIYQREGQQREIMVFLHKLLSDLGLQSKIRYRIPFYDRLSWICYLNPIKNSGVELAFIRGNELSNNHEILNFKERKQVAGISIYNLRELDLNKLRETIHEAILLDESVPYKMVKRN